STPHRASVNKSDRLTVHLVLISRCYVGRPHRTSYPTRRSSDLVGSGHTSYNQLTFNNSGLVEVQSGALDLTSDGTSSGTFDVAASGELQFQSQSPRHLVCLPRLGKMDRRDSTAGGSEDEKGNAN